MYPAIQHIIAYWAPPGERARFIGVFSGSSLGGVLGHGIVGAVSATDLHWSISFYCTALIGVIVWLYFIWTVTDRPDLHSRIADKEKIYIESSLGYSVNREKVRVRLCGEWDSQFSILFVFQKSIPYYKILKSGPVWALIVLNCGANFLQLFQMNSFPKYYHEVLGFLLPQVATILVSSWMIRFFSGIFFSCLGDYLAKKELMGIYAQRKFFCLFCNYLI